MNPIVSIDLVRAARRFDSFPKELLDRVETLAKEYEKFLLLIAKFGGPVAPTREIDEMWHLHMLHPIAYHRDCLRLFGKLLDHDGGFGKDAEEVPVLKAVHDRTARLWTQCFGESYGSSSTKCWHDCVGRCWHACRDAGCASEECSVACQ